MSRAPTKTKALPGAIDIILNEQGAAEPSSRPDPSLIVSLPQPFWSCLRLVRQIRPAFPFFTLAPSKAASQFVSRMQPWDSDLLTFGRFGRSVNAVSFGR